MQLTETELFVIMTERFYNFQNSRQSEDKKAFGETLKSLVELFTDGQSTIKLKEEPKPKTTGELLYEQLAKATTEGNLEAVQAYSQAIQRLTF
jgi:hypothetical protein